MARVPPVDGSVGRPYPVVVLWPWEQARMDEDRFNMSVRKFLKVVGVTSQREIEIAVREAVKAGRLRGNETLKARMTLEIGAISLRHEIDDEIEIG